MAGRTDFIAQGMDTDEMEFRDIYYAARLPSGELLPGAGSVADPRSVPVIVLRYYDNDIDIMAIVHSDMDKIEINHKLFDLDSREGSVVVELMEKHKPNDEPNPGILHHDLTIVGIVYEMDLDFINGQRILNGEEKILPQKEDLKLSSIIERGFASRV